MVVVSILLHVKFGSNDHREDAKIVKPPSYVCESHGSKLRQGEELLNDNKEIITDIKNQNYELDNKIKVGFKSSQMPHMTCP